MLGFLRKFIRGRQRHTRVRPKATWRPGLEMLEDRWAPALLTVNSVADNTLADSALTLREAIQVVDGTLGRTLSTAEQGQVSGVLGSNDTIQFNLPAGPQTTSLTGGLLSITNPVAINGPGAGSLTINGNNASRVFFVGASFSQNLGLNVSLSGLTIASGKDQYGGGLFNAATLTLSNVTLANNTATTNGGGGLYNNGAVTLNSCTFSGNTTLPNGSSATAGGGLLNLSAGTVTATNCTFSANTATGSGSAAGQGGAIANSGTMNVSGSTITGNTAAFGGGGIYSGTGSLTLTNCTVSNNTVLANPASTPHGGGILNGVATLTITGCTFTGNSAQGIGQGGALFNSAGSISLTSTKFNANSAGSNSGALETDGSATINGCSFTNNTSGGNFGAFRAVGGFTMNYSQVSGNFAAAEPGGGGYAQTGGLFTINNSTFANNTTPGIAGGIWTVGNTTLTNDTIIGNRGGTGGIWSGSSLTLQNCIVSGNYSGSSSTESNISGTFSGSNNLINVGNPGLASTFAPGSITFGVNGAVTGASAVAMNGTSGYVNLPASAFGNYPTSGSTSNYALTFETWFNAPSGSAGGVILGQIMGGITPGGSAPNAFVPAVMLGTDGKIYSTLFYHGSFGIGSSSTYSDGNWHHVAVTYNNGTEILYVDSVPVASTNGSEVAFSSSYGYFLGAGFTNGWPGGNGGWFYFNGRLDETAIYPTALSAAQVTAHYNLAAGGLAPAYSAAVLASSPTAYYHLNEAAGTIATDSSGNGRNATFVAPTVPLLAFNGGPTQTIAILPGSQAVDRGSNAFLPAGATDQRGAPRIINNTVDIGAFEAQPTSTTLTAAANQTATQGVAGTFNLGSLGDSSAVSSWSVGVDWGDNTLNTTFTASSKGSLGTQGHTYQSAGTFPVTVTIANGSYSISVATFEINVAPTPELITVNSLADNTTADSVLTLREAILFADGTLGRALTTAEQAQVTGPPSGTPTVQFNLGAGPKTITLSGGMLPITTNLAINGPGPSNLTINGNNASRVFYIGKSFTRTLSMVVSISGLTVAGGTDQFGGGLFNAVTLTLSNVAINNNTATVNGGGGIYNNGAVTLNSCTFSSNVTLPNGSSATSGGGLLNLNAGGVFATNCTFSGNTANGAGLAAGQGGALANTGTMSISGSIITANTAGFGGAGVYNGTGLLTLTNCTISNNISLANSVTPNQGGGLLNEVAATVTITGSTFSGNTVQGTGATAGQGGGIYNSGGTMTINTSNFTGNAAPSDGGGIYTQVTGPSNPVSINNSTFTSNFSGADGGGIRAHMGTIATITGCTFVANVASSEGGGVDASIAKQLAVTNSTFTGNYAGSVAGGLQCGYLGTAILTNDTITGNSVGNINGGGVNVRSSDVIFRNTIVAGNFQVGSLTPNDISDSWGDGTPADPAGANNLIGTGGSAGLVNGVNGNQIGVVNPGLATTVVPTLGAPGAVSGDTAMAMYGTAGYVTLPAAAFGNYPTSGSTTSYATSFETWFNAPAGSAGGVILGQIAAGVSPGGGAPSSFVPAVMLGTDGKIHATLFWHSGNGIASAGTYNDGNWHQVAVTYSGGTETLYIDGASIASENVSEVSYSSAYSYYLGAGYSKSWTGGNGGWFFFNGRLDETAIYPTGLSAAQVAAHYNAAAGSFATYSAAVMANSPGAYYHLDEASGTTATDSSGNGRSGSYSAQIVPLLASNGGPTQTIAILSSSPAIGHGSNSFVTAGETDQRGLPRIVNNTVDIGAFEVQTATPEVITVNSPADNTTADNVLTLREAILFANATLGRSLTAGEQAQVTGTIGLNPSIQFNLPAGPQTITLTQGALGLTASLSINGPGAASLTISGNNADRVFTIGQIWSVNLSQVVAINGLTISGGKQSYAGGLLNFGTLTVNNTTFANNAAGSSGGGGVYNVGKLTVNNCSFTGNSLTSGGSGAAINNISSGNLTVSGCTFTSNTGTGGAQGAGIANSGTVNVSGSTFTNNSADSNAGGIFNGSGATLTVSTSTIANNTSGADGGGIDNDGSATISASTLSGNSAASEGGGLCSIGSKLTMTNCTIYGNSAVSDGGGLTITSGTTTVTNCTVTANRVTTGTGGGIYNVGVAGKLNNTIVAGNFHGPAPSTTADDIAGTVDASSSFNLIGIGGAGGLTNGVNTNQVGVANPGLGALASNGGPTLTVALLTGSPAIAHGSNSFVVAGETDQRGLPRIVNGTVDIGAFEAQ